MPEYLAPGVYVEETSYRSKSIEGVGTSTAGFIGPARFGPVGDVPELITSLADFQRIYGGLDALAFGDGAQANFAAQAVRAYFQEGGSRLYFTRVFKPTDGSDGRASAQIGDAKTAQVQIQARHPGAHGNMQVSLRLRVSPNILGKDMQSGLNVLRGADDLDLVYIKNAPAKVSAAPGGQQPAAPASADVHGSSADATPPAADGSGNTPPTTPPTASAGIADGFYTIGRTFDNAKGRSTLQLRSNNTPQGNATIPTIDDLKPGTECYLVTLSVSAARLGERGKVVQEQLWTDLRLHAEHKQSWTAQFAPVAQSRSTLLYVPLVIQILVGGQPTAADPVAVVNALIPAGTAIAPGDLPLQRVMLTGGNDGVRPTSTEYEGDASTSTKTGLMTFEDVNDIAIVAAPGSTAGYKQNQQNADAIQHLLIAHAERMRYRVAVLDAGDNMLPSEVQAYRSQFDSNWAALYYPWVSTLDPVTDQMVNVPPSGLVAGIYARSDNEIGVHKAPANEVVRLAAGFELTLNKAQQEVLNPLGINCFRDFRATGLGLRLWGARTVSSDSEWKYLNVRRYFAYLEHSIDNGTQWVVFMPNDQNLWAKVKSTVEDFLFNEWKSGRLMGSKPEEAYFVKCDRTTMTQDDLDSGRLIVQVGVAPITPAEFVIFRIGQFTASGS